MKIRQAVRGIIIKDSKLFCIKNVRTIDNRDFWCTPGGGVDDGESILDALKRELIEELGVDPVIGKLLFVMQYKKENIEQTEFLFNIENVDDFLNIDLIKTSHGVKEIQDFKFIDPTEYNVLPEFLANNKIDLSINKVQFYSYL